MDIAAMSIDSSLLKVQSQVKISLLKDTMDSAESNASSLINQMLPVNNVKVLQDLGSILDVRA